MKLTLKTWLGLVVGFLVVAVGTFVAVDVFLGQRHVSMDEVVAMWDERSPAYMAVLEAEFPERHAELMAQTQTLMVEMPDGPAREAALDAARADVSAELTEAYSGLARRAPDESLRDWIGAVAQSIQKVYLEGDARLCGSFIDFGPDALEGSDILPELRPALDQRDAALFNALAGARDSSAEPVAPASEEDWAALDVEMSKDDVPASYAESLVEGDTTDAEYCPALVLLFNKIEVLPGETGQRIRAEYLANSFG